MSYHLYSSRAILLGSYPLGEDSKFISFLTEEYGSITALAQGIRLLKSKLRYHTNPFSLSELELVRGKDMWRCTAISPLNNQVLSQASHMLLTRLSKIIRRLIHGEEENRNLFGTFSDLIDFLYSRELNKDEETIVEIVSLGNILQSLGYFSPTDKEKEFLGRPIEELPLKMEAETRRDFISHINSSLEASHL